MKNWIKKRSNEPSTYLGVAGLIAALGTLLKADHTDAIADAVATQAGTFAAGDYTTGLGVVAMSLIGIFMSEKGEK